LCTARRGRRGDLDSCDLPDRPGVDAGGLVTAQRQWAASGRNHRLMAVSVARDCHVYEPRAWLLSTIDQLYQLWSSCQVDVLQ